MSTDDVRKKIDREKKETQKREERMRKEYQSLPTVEEWDRAVVDFAKRIFYELFPESRSGPKITYRMKYSKGYWGGTSLGGSPPNWYWLFVKDNIELSFTVYNSVPLNSPERQEKSPRRVRGYLCTHNSQSYVNAKLRSWVEDYNRGDSGRTFSSPSELEAASDDIFEYLYRKKNEKQ